MTDDYQDFDSANDPDAEDGNASDSDEREERSAQADSDGKDETSKTDEDALKQWQSKADKAEARANKLEKELAKYQRQQSVEGERKAPKAPASSSEDPWVAASKDNFRDDLFKSDPRLEALGFDPSLIQGSTPAEMRQSFVSLQGTVDRMETGIRNRVLVEHGLEPVPGSGERASGVNFKTMPTDEFNKLVDKALQG